jgi:hypothetical protein
MLLPRFLARPGKFNYSSFCRIQTEFEAIQFFMQSRETALSLFFSIKRYLVVVKPSIGSFLRKTALSAPGPAGTQKRPDRPPSR